MRSWNDTCEIRNFDPCGEEQSEQIRADLGLTMSSAKFATCVAFYTKIKRDPLFGELQLLDRLVGAASDPSATSFVQLDTVDAAMAETYADMMNKRREWIPDFHAPMTLGEAFSLASAALERGGKDRGCKGISLLFSDMHSQISEDRSVGAVGSSSLLRVSKGTEPNGPAKVGDVYLLIRRGTLTPRAFRKEIRKLIGNSDFSTLLRGSLSIGENGVLPLLLSTAHGLYIDLDRMGFGMETSPEMLAGEFAGDCVAVLPKQNVDTALAKISSIGMKGSVFAAVTEGWQTVIVTSDRTKLILHSAFLRGLNTPSPVSVILKEEEKNDAIKHSPLNRSVCRYLADESLPSEAVKSPGATVSVATSRSVNRPFRTSLLTALTPILTLAVCGGDYSEMRYAVDLEIPNAADHGQVLAAVLGVYRAQAELGIPAAAQRIRHNPTDNKIGLTVFAVAKEVEPLPCRFARTESGVYLVSAPMGENGIPNFPAFRSMLADLSALARNGKILSAKILANESVTDALRKMRHDGLFAHLTDISVAAEGELPCAVILESADALPFARIGSVAEESVSVANETEKFRFPEGNNLIWRKTPEAVVVADPNDGDAQIFADRLCGFGIDAAVFSPEEIGPLSRAMLTANAVFVCESAEWKENGQIAFARSVLARNGGELISVGSVDTIPSNIPHRSFPNGFSFIFEEK